MSSCISGGGRTYAFDIEIPKPPSPSTLIRTPHSQSPSSTLSESSNSPIAISTRKPRTPRKRPNQTYNEAATLLSKAYPKIFPPEYLPSQPCKIIARPQESVPFLDSGDMLLPFRAIDGLGCLLGSPQFEPKVLLLDSNCKTAALICDEDRYRDGDEESHKLVGCRSPGLSRFSENRSMIYGEEEEEEEDFGAESILDEEIGEGIDSIMGRQCDDDVDSDAPGSYCNVVDFPSFGKFGGNGDCGFGNAAATAALRNVDREGDWWRFPTIDIREISPKLNKVSMGETETEKKKESKKKDKKKKGVSVSVSASASAGVKSCDDSAGVDSIPKPSWRPKLLLKLNYEEVLRAWSDQDSPFPEAIPGTESAGSNDTHARLAQMDLFAENGGGGGGGLREASVMRYKEKRRTRLFSKKIRYQVRKVNADLRPRMKGRFVRRLLNSNAQS